MEANAANSSQQAKTKAAVGGSPTQQQGSQASVCVARMLNSLIFILNYVPHLKQVVKVAKKLHY